MQFLQGWITHHPNGNADGKSRGRTEQMLKTKNWHHVQHLRLISDTPPDPHWVGQQGMNKHLVFQRWNRGAFAQKCLTKGYMGKARESFLLICPRSIDPQYDQGLSQVLPIPLSPENINQILQTLETKEDIEKAFAITTAIGHEIPDDLRKSLEEKAQQPSTP